MKTSKLCTDTQFIGLFFSKHAIATLLHEVQYDFPGESQARCMLYIAHACLLAAE
jgi:hypothetical protein